MSKVCYNNSRCHWVMAFVAVLAIYVLSHGLMFCVNGVFWDDFTIWNTSQSERASAEAVFNNPFLTWYNGTITSIDDLGLQLMTFRTVSFLMGLLSVVAIMLILRKITGNYAFTMMVTLLVAACGLNRCNMLICCSHYTISNALFFGGVLFFVYDFFSGKWWNKLVCSLFWFTSLLIWKSAALLIPLAVVVASCIKTNFRWNVAKSYLSALKYVFFRYWYIVLTCLVFLGIYATTLRPQGEYSEYYSVLSRNLLFSPLTSVLTSFHIFLNYLAVLLSAFAFGDSLLSLMPILGAGVFYCFYGKGDSSHIPNTKSWVLISCLFFIVAIWPQMLIRRVIYTIDLNTMATRIASLAPLPISILLICLLTRMPPDFQRMAFSFLLSASVFYSISTYMDYERGYEKNLAIQHYFEAHPELNGKTVRVVDRASDRNAYYGDYMRSYEYKGIAKLAYGNETESSFVIDDSLGSNYDARIIIESHAVTANRYVVFLTKFFDKNAYTEYVDSSIKVLIEQ